MANVDLTPVYKALAEIGVNVLPEHKADFEKLIEPLADADANALVSAIASHIKLTGIAGIANGPLKNALVESEPQLDVVINSSIDGGYDALIGALQKIANGK